MAKYDSATNKSIEILPRDPMDMTFDLVVQKRSQDVMDAFLQSG